MGEGIGTGAVPEEPWWPSYPLPDDCSDAERARWLGVHGVGVIGSTGEQGRKGTTWEWAGLCTVVVGCSA